MLLKALLREWREITILILLVTLGLSVPMCSEKKQDLAQSQLNTQTMREAATVRQLKDSSLIATQRQIIAADKWEMQNLTAKVDGLTRLTHQVRYTATFTAPKVVAPLISPVVHTDSVDGAQYLRVPVRYRLKHEWYQAAGLVDGVGVHLDTLRVVLRPTVSFGDLSHKWYQVFKPWEPSVTIQEANPYVRLSDVQNAVLSQRPPRFTVGLQAGYGVVFVPTPRFGPYVGLGAQWQILRWR